MGYFSWIYSDTGRQMLIGKVKDSHLLVPFKFRSVYGDSILEACYGGYGRFGIYDVYELVADWNRDMIPEIIRRMNNHNWGAWDRKVDIGFLQNYYNNGPDALSKDERRWVGILMTQTDELNTSLEYPIKIVENPVMYRMAEPSRHDPNQGTCTKRRSAVENVARMTDEVYRADVVRAMSDPEVDGKPVSGRETALIRRVRRMSASERSGLYSLLQVPR